jgi:hypothetical protein
MQNITTRPLQFGELVRGKTVASNLSGGNIPQQWIDAAEQHIGPVIDEFIREHAQDKFHQDKTVTLSPKLHVQFGYPGYAVTASMGEKQLNLSGIGPIESPYFIKQDLMSLAQQIVKPMDGWF